MVIPLSAPSRASELENVLVSGIPAMNVTLFCVHYDLECVGLFTFSSYSVEVKVTEHLYGRICK